MNEQRLLRIICSIFCLKSSIPQRFLAFRILRCLLFTLPPITFSPDFLLAVDSSPHKLTVLLSGTLELPVPPQHPTDQLFNMPIQYRWSIWRKNSPTFTAAFTRADLTVLFEIFSVLLSLEPLSLNGLDNPLSIRIDLI